MKNSSAILIIGLAVSILSGCATIMRDNQQAITFDSDVEKVDLEIKNKKGRVVFKGQTPITATFKTSSSGYFSPDRYTITASKEGYKDKDIVLNWGISAWYGGNIIFGGLLGLLIIDPITGDMFYIEEPDSINMTKL